MGIMGSSLTSKRPNEVGSNGSNISEFLILFGSIENPWEVEDWKEVSDSVRGGRSIANLDLIDQSNRLAGVKFFGELDSKTLGGAGFASRAYRPASNKPILIDEGDDRFNSFFIETEAIGDYDVNRFTFNVKNFDSDLVQEAEEGGEKTSSSLVYEFDFEVPSRIPSSSSLKKSYKEYIRIDIPFKSLKPTYRGRPKEDSKPFDPKKIKELSMMCRSFFDQQSGKFDLRILRIGVFFDHKIEKLLSIKR